MSQPIALFVAGTIAATVEALGGRHFARPQGSYCTGNNFATDTDTILTLQGLDWSEVIRDDLPEGVAFGDCRYFEAVLPEGSGGMTAAVDVESLTAEERETITVQIGHHGNEEMVSEVIKAKPTDKVKLITGTHEGNEVVFTWYPGDFTRLDHTVKLAR